MSQEEYQELVTVAAGLVARLRQAGNEIKMGNEITARTHLDQAHHVCERLKEELLLIQ